MQKKLSIENITEYQQNCSASLLSVPWDFPSLIRHVRMTKKFTNPLRIWIVGSSILATAFFIVAVLTDFWVMKEYHFKNSTLKNVKYYFGLWKKCQVTQLYVTTKESNATVATVVLCRTFDGNALPLPGTNKFSKTICLWQQTII